MKTSVLLLFALLGIAACEQEQAGSPLPEHGQGSQPLVQNLNLREVPRQLLSLQTPSGADSLAHVLEGNLFGKFFADRVAFFIIQQPTNRLYNAPIKALTLYYLDGQLSQIRYSLQQDVLDSLIRQHGTFKITGYDSLNQAIIKANQVVSLQQQEVKFNRQLTNFALKWDLEGAQIVYKVNRHNALDPFHYIERLKGFDAAYKRIRHLEK